jgi:hypothetical protein
LDNDAFDAGGVQIFQFGTGQPRCWSPARSYLRYTVTVTGSSTAAGLSGPSEDLTKTPKFSEAIALAENCVANAYTNGYFLGGGATVSQCVNFLPQASAIEGRTTNSLAWLKSLGAGYQWNGDFASRVAAISRSVNTADDGKTGSTINSNGLPGFSQDEGKQTIAKPIDVTIANAERDAAVAYTASLLANTLGANVTIADIGSTLVINGVPYTITPSGGGVGLSPRPPADITATNNWYIVKRNTGKSDQAINTVDVLWRPTAMGFFSYDGWIGSGDWQLNLTPNVNYKIAMLQTLNKNECSVAITGVRFYMCQMKMSIPNQITTLHLKEFQIQSKPYSSNLVFTVPASTEMLYVFVQDGSAGRTTAIPPSSFTLPGQKQNNVKQLQLTYANLTKPQTLWLSGFKAPPATGVVTPAQNALVQFYNQHQQELGRANDATGVETFNQWLERGALYAFNYVRDSNERGTEVQMSITIDDPVTGAPIIAAAGFNPQVFVAAEYRRIVEMTQQDGAIVAVKAISA